jgi:uncharacterized repeat protein (TIGR01451 family)
MPVKWCMEDNKMNKRIIIIALVTILVIPLAAVYAGELNGSTDSECSGYDYWRKFNEKGDLAEQNTDANPINLTLTTQKDEGEFIGFDWSSQEGIAQIVVKAGNDGSNLYQFDVPYPTAGSGSTKNDKGISHITFCWNDPKPAISLEKSADPQVYSSVNDDITYTYEITNTGNVAVFAPYTVSDDKVSVSCPSEPASLAVGDTVTCTAVYSITQADLNAGSVTNTAVATAKDEAGSDVDSNQDSATVTADQNKTLILDKSASPMNYSSVGESIQYTYQLKNNGNVALSGPFSVSDDKATVSCPEEPASLSPSSSLTCTATYVITEEDLIPGSSVTNTAIAYAEGGNVVSNTDSETVEGPKQSPDITLVKTADPQVYSSVNDDITYTFTATNTGNVTLTNVVINDPLTGTVDKLMTPSTLAPGESATASATYTITQADMDAGQITNVATVTGYDPSDNTVEDQDDETVVDPSPDPAISLEKTADPLVFTEVGELITYTFTVTNTGDVTLTNVVIDDPLTSSVDLAVSPSTLAPGESGTATATYTTTQADIDAGQILNTATATGKDPNGTSVQDQDDETVEGPKQEPEITLVKTAVPQDYSSVGETITYTFAVTNTGNVTLSNVNIDDPLTGSVDLAVTPSTLAPGESGTATATYNTTQDDLNAGEILNTATATGSDPGGNPVQDTDDETVVGQQNPAIMLLKSADPQVYSSVGETITYTFTVTNTGNVTLTDVEIDDALTGSVDLAVTPATLAPGASGTATATFTTTQDNINSGQILNTATATGKDPNGVSVQDEDDETVEGPKQEPEITLVKTADPQLYYNVGDIIIYTFTATNTGNVTLTNVVINDPLTRTVEKLMTPSTLAPGESATASATYTITQADMDAGQVTNVATVTGYDPDDNPVENEDDEVVVDPNQNPAISLEKTADPLVFTEVGELITYTFTVTNTGDVTLTNVVIDDPLTGSVDLPVTPSTLAPGASGTATATYNTTQADVNAGIVNNTATATGTPPSGLDVSDDDSAAVEGPKQSPDITLIKTANPQVYTETGEVITFTFTVTNTGNVTLTDVVIDDPLTGSVNLSVSPSTLAPGATGTAMATYTITSGDVSSGQVVNVANATGYDPSDNSVEDTDEETIEGPKQSPDINLIKTASPQTYNEVGDVITYTFTVTNTGNATLTNVVIDDPLTGSVNLAVSPSTLDPGETGTATATYTITQADITAGKVTNSATATGSSGGEEYSDTDTETVPKEVDPTPDKPSGGNETNLMSFIDTVLTLLCKIGFRFSQCD